MENCLKLPPCTCKQWAQRANKTLNQIKLTIIEGLQNNHPRIEAKVGNGQTREGICRGKMLD